MARIRSIKPEFPQSESMGNVSRDARLTFIQLWTLADDEGRLRGNSRMLASLLFPYDDGEDGHVSTTSKDVEAWLVELERESCIVRYQIDGAAYVQICNWLIHQKIDKPSKSKIPAFDEPSREVANPREVSSEEGKGKDQGVEGKGEENPPLPASPPTRIGEICVLLRRSGVNTSPDAVGKVEWSANDAVTDDVLLDAVVLAKKRSPRQITPAYLSPIIADLLTKLETARSSALVAGKDYV
jgi:hypothetical protein